MSLPVFVSEDLSSGQEVAELRGAEGRHAVTVKRIGVGERIEIVDARGTRAQVEVTEVSGKDRLRGRILSRHREPQPTPEVTVVQAIPKSPHAELAVDLLTQAGADRILAWQAERCVARWLTPAQARTAQGPPVASAKAEKALGKWQDRAREAAKQARRSWVPEIRGPVGTPWLVEWLGRCDSDTVICVLHEDARVTLADLHVAGVRRVVLIVGPEGGIGHEELAKLESAGARPATLGPLVARASAAGAFGLAALGALTGRW